MFSKLQFAFFLASVLLFFYGMNNLLYEKKLVDTSGKALVIMNVNHREDYPISCLNESVENKKNIDNLDLNDISKIVDKGFYACSLWVYSDFLPKAIQGAYEVLYVPMNLSIPYELIKQAIVDEDNNLGCVGYINIVNAICPLTLESYSEKH